MSKRPTAFKEGIISYEEGLPLPFVHYPGHYGAFIAFSRGRESELYFCSCATDAIENYIKVSGSSNRTQHPFTYGIKNFPERIRIRIRKDVLSGKCSIKDLPKKVVFEDAICHKCLGELPRYKYCHEMYGGKFKQAYGWYIAQKALEWGIDPVFGLVQLPKAVPEEVIFLYKSELLPASIALSNKKPHTKGWYDAQSEFMKKSRKILNLVEDDVRVAVGYRKIGEGWVSETQLCYLIKKIFPNLEIIRHYRPKFLENLELDIYVPDISLGIEYQGEQHFKPIKHWGGEKALGEVLLRDKRKEVLCRRNKIRLVKFRYDEDISSHYVKNKIDKAPLK